MCGQHYDLYPYLLWPLRKLTDRNPSTAADELYSLRCRVERGETALSYFSVQGSAGSDLWFMAVRFFCHRAPCLHIAMATPGHMDLLSRFYLHLNEVPLPSRYLGFREKSLNKMVIFIFFSSG